LKILREAAGDRIAVYSPENDAGVPIYVHAKVCVIDDVWACIGSDNFNRRSWTHDSELNVAVLDGDLDDRAPTVVGTAPAARFARDLRLRLAAEHLGRDSGECDELIDPDSAFEAFARSARDLRQWHDDNGTGPRPKGRLLSVDDQKISALTRAWATPVYRILYDPDGRPRKDR